MKANYHKKLIENSIKNLNHNIDTVNSSVCLRYYQFENVLFCNFTNARKMNDVVFAKIKSSHRKGLCSCKNIVGFFHDRLFISVIGQFSPEEAL